MNQPIIPMILELKYCERCAGLWLRPQGAAASYCRPCAQQLELAELQDPASPLRRGRPPLPATSFEAAAACATAGRTA